MVSTKSTSKAASDRAAKSSSKGSVSKKTSPSNRPTKSTAKPKEEKMPEIKMPTLQQLLEAGAHFGHKISRWNPAMDEYIYDSRQGIHIIDLTRTMDLLKDAVEFLVKASRRGNILLVGTKGQAATLIKSAGVNHGAYYISRRWPGGLLTNYKNIRRSVKKMIQIEEDLASMKGYETKKERLMMEKDLERLSKLYEGIRFMDKSPEAMVVIDTRVEKNAIKEARKMGVKVVGIIDTNCDPNLVDYPIPANDDAIRSLELFINVLVQGFSSSESSARLIGLRNDHAAKISRMHTFAEQEAERKARELEMEARRLKQMKEGKAVGESGELEGKIVRIVRQEEEEKPSAGSTEEVKTDQGEEVAKEEPMAEEKKGTRIVRVKASDTGAKSATPSKSVRKPKTTQKAAKKTTPKKTTAKKTSKKTTRKSAKKTTKKATKKTTTKKKTKK